MKIETYLSAIEKIESDPLSFLFSSHAEKRERQLSKFQRAVEHGAQRTVGGAWFCWRCRRVHRGDLDVSGIHANPATAANA